MSKTLTELRTEAKELADEAGSDFVSDAQWDIWINRGYSELWTQVFRSNKAILEATFDFTITTGNSVSIAALKHRAVLKVERDPGGSTRHFVRRTSLSDKNLTDRRSYRVAGQTLYIERSEWANGSYRLYYVGDAATLAGPVPGPQVDTSTVLDPWWQYSPLWAAIRAVEKDDKGAGDLIQKLADLRAEIDNELRVRDGIEPMRTQDMQPDTDFGSAWPWFSQ